MHTALIKDGVITDVWLNGTYEGELTEGMESFDYLVYPGMVKVNNKYAFPKIEIDETEKALKELSEKTRREIFSKAPETAQLTALMDSVVELYDRLGFDIPPKAKAVLDIVNDGLAEHAVKEAEILNK